jgi:hypothetical protein
MLLNNDEDFLCKTRADTTEVPVNILSHSQGTEMTKLIVRNTRLHDTESGKTNAGRLSKSLHSVDLLTRRA